MVKAFSVYFSNTNTSCCNFSNSCCCNYR